MPIQMQSALIFHYNLKFYNKDADNFEGISLKRFVMQVLYVQKVLYIFYCKLVYKMGQNFSDI